MKQVTVKALLCTEIIAAAELWTLFQSIDLQLTQALDRLYDNLAAEQRLAV